MNPLKRLNDIVMAGRGIWLYSMEQESGQGMSAHQDITKMRIRCKGDRTSDEQIKELREAISELKEDPIKVELTLIYE